MKTPASRRTFSRNLDWNLLKVFHEIATSGSLSQAAENLNRKQPTISISLRRLEDMLGTRLCERGPRGMTLTRSGRALAEMIQRTVDTVDSIPDTMAGNISGISGELHLLVISNLVVSELDDAVRDFHKEYPDVELHVGVAPWQDVHTALLRRETDVGIAPARVFHPELDYRHIFNEVHRPYCGRGSPLYGRSVVSTEELAECAFVLTEGDEPEELRRYRLEHGFGTHVGGRSAHLEEAKRLAKLGIGVCFLPEGFAAADVMSGVLHPVVSNFEMPSVPVYAITHTVAESNPTCRLFIDCLEQRAGSRRPRRRSRGRSAAE